MKLKNIQYSESYEYVEYGMKRWSKTGIEAELDENENPMEAHATLRQLINDLKADTIASLEEYRGTHITDVGERKVEKIADGIQASLDEISKCQTIDELKSCWLMSKGNLTLSAAYKTKQKQLEDAK